jgi:hypothetical protein
MIRRLLGWFLDKLSGDRELDVEPQYHPYYPGEAFDADHHDV